MRRPYPPPRRQPQSRRRSPSPQHTCARALAALPPARRVPGMGFQDLTREEIELVLDKERVIRIAFSANGESFVVPVFYVWHEGALCGLTTPGRKTRLGEANAEVAFQIDSTFV